MTTKYPAGVSFDRYRKKNPYKAEVRYRKKRFNLGWFESIELASKMYRLVKHEVMMERPVNKVEIYKIKCRLLGIDNENIIN